MIFLCLIILYPFYSRYYNDLNSNNVRKTQFTWRLNYRTWTRFHSHAGSQRACQAVTGGPIQRYIEKDSKFKRFYSLLRWINQPKFIRISIQIWWQYSKNLNAQRRGFQRGSCHHGWQVWAILGNYWFH